jgi:aspartate/methionine/tyrosine aminotransferase
MRVDDFQVERWLNEYEEHVEVNLAEICVNPFTLLEFLQLTGNEDMLEKLLGVKLTYGHILGHPRLRGGIASLYRNRRADEVLVTGGAIEANYNSFYSLIEPGDRVVTFAPTYQQLYSVAQGFGAHVDLLWLKPEDSWLPDLEELKRLVDRRTKMIVVSNPNNPTGSLMDEKLLRAVVEIAEDAGAILHSDETYRGLYAHEGDWTPSAVDVYEKAVATGSFSKALSLTGLRLGWITAGRDIIEECTRHRDYTTISKGVLDEVLATVAVDHYAKILERSNGIIQYNLGVVDRWLLEQSTVSWVRPRAASVGFFRLDAKTSSIDFCKRLISDESTLLVPGECFGVTKHVRLGYGNDTKTLVEGLKRVKELLSRQ